MNLEIVAEREGHLLVRFTDAQRKFFATETLDLRPGISAADTATRLHEFADRIQRIARTNAPLK